jgi:hypothetical protein
MNPQFGALKNQLIPFIEDSMEILSQYKESELGP